MHKKFLHLELHYQINISMKEDFLYGSVFNEVTDWAPFLYYLPYKVRKMILKIILALMLSYSKDFFSSGVGNIFGPMSHKEMEVRIPR